MSQPISPLCFSLCLRLAICTGLLATGSAFAPLFSKAQSSAPSPSTQTSLSALPPHTTLPATLPSLTYRIAGTLSNAITGAPLAHVTVSALSETHSYTLQSVVTDHEGHFVFEGLPAAKYPLTASRRGYLSAFYDEHEQFNSAIVTGSMTGSEAYIDIEHLNFRLMPEAMLHGVITGDGGDPVEGATVHLFRRAHDHGLGKRITSPDSTTSDDTGAYEFTNLSPGDYLLAVTAKPWFATPRNPARSLLYLYSSNDPGTALDVAYPVTFYDATSDEATAVPIALSGGSEEEANINLHAVPALDLSIPLPHQEEDPNFLTGTATGPAPELHQLIFGIQIAAENKSPSSTADGMAEFAGLAPGHYELEQGDPTRIVALDATNSQQVDPNSGILVGSIRGTLQSSSGQPFTEALNLTLIQADGSPQHEPIQAVSTDGKFQFPSVPPGNWTLWAENSDTSLPVVSLTVNGFAHAGSDLTVPDHRIELTVTLSENLVHVNGVVRKAGKGFPGAMVVLVPKDPRAFRALVRRDQSDSDGSFSLRDVPSGLYTIVAIEGGWTLDWARPEVMRRYLLGGMPVTVTGTTGTGTTAKRSGDGHLSSDDLSHGGQLMQLPGAVRLQQR